MTNSEESKQLEEDHEYNADQKLFRNGIALVSFVMIIVVLIYWLFFPQAKDLSDTLVSGIEYIIGGLITIVVAYQGISTAGSVGHRFANTRLQSSTTVYKEEETQKTKSTFSPRK